MKKYLVILLLLVAINPVEAKWTPVNFSVWIPYTTNPKEFRPNVSLFRESMVTGIDFGFFGTRSKTVLGLQHSIGIAYITNSLIGLQAGFFRNIAKNVYGIQFAIGLNIVEDSGIGIQIGLVGNNARDFTGIQFGGVNANFSTKSTMYFSDPTRERTSKMSTEKYRGLQCAYGWNIVEDFSGLQIGLLFNYSKTMRGIQIGIVNYSKSLTGIQIGILNIAKNSPIPYMIGINVGL